MKTEKAKKILFAETEPERILTQRLVVIMCNSSLHKVEMCLLTGYTIMEKLLKNKKVVL